MTTADTFQEYYTKKCYCFNENLINRNILNKKRSNIGNMRTVFFNIMWIQRKKSLD